MQGGGLLQRARDAADRGEILLAVDLADRGLADAPDDLGLQHVVVLALARAGATDAAARRFAEGPLARARDREVLALGARIAKDLALRATGATRVKRARRAALRYAAIGGSYPLTNAATLRAIAGDTEAAAQLAARALDALEGEPSSAWTEVTRAEALLVLGLLEDAGAALAAAEPAGLEPVAAASAYNQLALLCGLRGVDLALLAPLRGSGVLHFCGHVIGGRFAADDEDRVSAAIAEELDREPVASAYGALAAGADLLVAEALLDRGVELHVVLPCAHEHFVEASVRPSGEEWVDRFERCLLASVEVTVASPSAHTLDDGLLTFSSELAMGLALLRARWLHADTRQLAVWNGSAPESTAGTAADVATWRRRGGRTVVVEPPRTQDPRPGRVTGAPPTGRRTLALLFADVVGYSKLHDEALPHFTQHVLAVVSEVLARHDDTILTSNTWGDAVLVAVLTTEAAAHIALDLQDAMADVESAADGAQSATFRLAAHVGPVYVVANPLRGRPDVVGEHVNRTARLEPVTPPGSVYVTEAFAALLELSGAEDVACDYVGHLPGAKDIGRMRMHHLRRCRESTLGG